MTWTKLSDDFPDDCWTLSDAAFRMHVEGLVWSNRKLLDALIPQEDVRRFAKRPEAVEELVQVGWWEQREDGFVIRHHAGYQRTAEQIVAAQERGRVNGKAGGRPRKKTDIGIPVANPDSNPQGQDRTGQVLDMGNSQKLRVVNEWPVLRLCAVCSGPLDSAITDEAHPTCAVSA
jgi:hypothetical protein